MDLVIVKTASSCWAEKGTTTGCEQSCPLDSTTKQELSCYQQRKQGKEKKPQGIRLINEYCITNVGGGSSVYSTSKGDKLLGCPKRLASLIRAGDYDPSKAQSMTTAEVKSVCETAESTSLFKQIPQRYR